MLPLRKVKDISTASMPRPQVCDFARSDADLYARNVGPGRLQYSSMIYHNELSANPGKRNQQA